MSDSSGALQQLAAEQQAKREEKERKEREKAHRHETVVMPYLAAWDGLAAALTSHDTKKAAEAIERLVATGTANDRADWLVRPLESEDIEDDAVATGIAHAIAACVEGGCAAHSDVESLLTLIGDDDPTDAVRDLRRLVEPYEQIGTAPTEGPIYKLNQLLDSLNRVGVFYHCWSRHVREFEHIGKRRDFIFGFSGNYLGLADHYRPAGRVNHRRFRVYQYRDWREECELLVPDTAGEVRALSDDELIATAKKYKVFLPRFFPVESADDIGTFDAACSRDDVLCVRTYETMLKKESRSFHKAVEQSNRDLQQLPAEYLQALDQLTGTNWRAALRYNVLDVADRWPEGDKSLRQCGNVPDRFYPFMVKLAEGSPADFWEKQEALVEKARDELVAVRGEAVDSRTEADRDSAGKTMPTQSGNQSMGKSANTITADGSSPLTHYVQNIIAIPDALEKVLDRDAEAERILMAEPALPEAISRCERRYWDRQAEQAMGRTVCTPRIWTRRDERRVNYRRGLVPDGVWAWGVPQCRTARLIARLEPRQGPPVHDQWFRAALNEARDDGTAAVVCPLLEQSKKQYESLIGAARSLAQDHDKRVEFDHARQRLGSLACKLMDYTKEPAKRPEAEIQEPVDASPATGTAKHKAAGSNSGASHTTGDPYPTPNNYARDKWIYENIDRYSCAKLSVKLKETGKPHHWALVTSRNGLKDAAKKYAGYAGLPVKGFPDRRNSKNA